MAPPAKITEEETGPSTLPADFGEWDSGAPPATLPDNFNDFDAAPKPPAKSAAAKATVSRAAGRSPDNSASRAQASVYADTEGLSEPPQSKRAKVAEGSKRRAEAEGEDEGKGKGKGKVVFVAIGAILVLALLILIPLNYHKSAPKAALPNQSAVQQSTTMSPTETSKPKPTAAATPETTPVATPAAETAQPGVQSDMMNKQLNAPTRISPNIKTADRDAPPTSGFGATGIEGMGGNSGGAIGGGVFNAKNEPKVTVEVAKTSIAKTLNVSGSVMAGRSISKTPPVYPSFARTARVEGTVVLHAAISKAGTIANLSVVSGPTMLRQAALDAVKTWRYKPYLLNNEPVEVETTVNVIFVLGG